MRFSASFLLSSSLWLLVQQSAARPSRCAATQQVAKSIYLLSNEDANSVIAVPVGMDGQLFGGTSTATGGKGSLSIDGATNQTAATDGLVSQSSLTVAGHKLFAVNAGSNSVTMFLIDRTDASKLQMVGQPVAVPGEFPNTVAASKKHKIVCVGTTGAVAGVSCSSFSGQGGIEAMDELRPIDLQQTTPPVGPTNTVSQVLFSDDENTLFVMVKGDPAVNNTGFVASFPVENGQVSQQGTQSSPDGTAVLFGSAPIPGTSDIFATDASFGAAVLSVDSAGVATVKGQAAIDGQKATCWAAVSSVTNSAFVSDVATNRLVQMSLQDASIMSIVDLSANGDPGLIDLKAAGQFIYALSPGTGATVPAVTVVDATSKSQVQHFELQALGASNRAQGMAVLL
ncbi:hypothetical protein B0J13DRAFT_587025 [Dactylonectria estremocensis]|uniref:3-carboxymuconate cyclase n=1 Tax=Dactylonectria estremocensis TaxID=1079267 RepID=A0A9P9EG75_9HYPO|nr:hypothetical protein B0J13DRAFT_587025 [Dactylonectria estremocensis]